nr:copper-binding protein [uncultured Roseateles sp.]
MKKTSTQFLLAAFIALSASSLSAQAQAQAQTSAGMPPESGASSNSGATANEALTEGEIRKVDLEQAKLTIKHGEIKNLAMPGMTMVFRVKDAAQLATLKAGDKIRFRAERGNPGYVVTDLQVVAP